MANVKVYRYGLLPPIESSEEVRGQMRLAHQYRNTLVEIERYRRAALRALFVSRADVAALERAAKAAEAEVERTYQAVKMSKALTRSRAIPDTLRAELTAARMAKKEASQLLREGRAALKDDPEIVVERDAINERAAFLRRSARAHCGVYWGTYLCIEAADQAARNAPLYDGTEPNDPRFVHWSGEGFVAVQIQKGMSASNLMSAKDTRLRMEPCAPPPGADPTSKRSARRKYTVLALRVGSEGREPIWARWRCVMHRPLPDDAVVKWAKVHVQKRGPREEWSVTLTVELQEVGRRTPASGSVAVDLGWRTEENENGLRVAAWRGTDGNEGRLILSEWDLSRIEKANDLRAIRDKNFNTAREALLDSAAKLLPLSSTPSWFQGAVRTLAQWRSPARLAQLAQRWKQQRFDGDAIAYEALEVWRYHDFHLWEWEASQRVKALRNRREIYRVFAARLAAVYETLVIEEFDLRKMAVRPVADSTEKVNETARTMRHAAAVSELREALVQAFAGPRRHVAREPAQDTTRSCNACGSIEKWDQAAEVSHTCSGCGAHWDQDDNAALNLLKRFERSGDTNKSGVARDDEDGSESAGVQESRWARATRMAKEKVARGRDRSQNAV